MSDPTAPQQATVYPVLWHDEDGKPQNAWAMNHFTGEIHRDPEGDPLFTTTPPPEESEKR